MAGGNGLFLAAFYCLLDHTSWQPRWLRSKWRPLPGQTVCFGKEFAVGLTDTLRPLVWVGMNTIFIYLFSPAGGLWEALQGYVYWDDPDNNLVDATYNHVFCSAPVVHIGNVTHHSKDWCRHGAHGCNWNTQSVCTGGIFNGVHQRYAQLLWILLRIAFWFGVAGVLHFRGWYWAL